VDLRLPWEKTNLFNLNYLGKPEWTTLKQNKFVKLKIIFSNILTVYQEWYFGKPEMDQGLLHGSQNC